MIEKHHWALTETGIRTPSLHFFEIPNRQLREHVFRLITEPLDELERLQADARNAHFDAKAAATREADTDVANLLLQIQSLQRNKRRGHDSALPAGLDAGPQPTVKDWQALDSEASA